jgi:hypothetical protein
MEKITVPKAILMVLDETKGPITPTEIYNIIISKKYYDFSNTLKPENTVNTQAGRFIRRGDTRVKRLRKEGSGYFYYLTKYEQIINFDSFQIGTTVATPIYTSPKKDFKERDLHKLFSTYLNSTNIYSKTIIHEKSTRDKKKKKWTHPDIIGVQFITLQNNSSRNFLKAINKKESFKLMSYELKKEIRNDYELKKAYFQAVSNSSWANYGYLVSYEIENNLLEEIKRLNESFGIGVIELYSNPFQSKILFQSKYRELDINTIDKLCKNNIDFNSFLEHMEKLLNADERYYKATENELANICDKYFTYEDETIEYCKEKNIPIEENDED